MPGFTNLSAVMVPSPLSLSCCSWQGCPCSIDSGSNGPSKGLSDISRVGASCEILEELYALLQLFRPCNLYSTNPFDSCIREVGVGGRVRHIMLSNVAIMLCSRHPKNHTLVPKIMLVSDHYARVMLAEMNERYHPNESCNCFQDDCQP